MADRGQVNHETNFNYFGVGYIPSFADCNGDILIIIAVKFFSIKKIAEGISRNERENKIHKGYNGRK